DDRAAADVDRAGDRRYGPRALRHRADDRPWLPAMDAGAHFWHQRRLSGPRRIAVLVRLSKLLARPDDAGDPQDLAHRQRAFGVRRIDRAQFDRLCGLALELLHRHLAVLGL